MTWEETELPVSVQLLSVQPNAPPPYPPKAYVPRSLPAQLSLTVQLFSVPPPYAPPAKGADPWVNVNPERLAPLVKYTHRISQPFPAIVVNCGPLMLRMFSGLSTSTRLAFRMPVS